jgi:adenosylhomocysteine nucleosidase
MANAGKVVIVAALEREVRFLVKNWRISEREHQGMRFKFYESDHAVLVCGGIGPQSAFRAAEAAVALYHPELLISAGFAGALVPDLKVGEWLFPEFIVAAGDGRRVGTDINQTHVRSKHGSVLVSSDTVVGRDQKADLARTHGADAVDMEALTVAQVARAYGLKLLAVKVISDEIGFDMPPLARFVRSNGDFNTWGFLVWMGPRIWLWPRLVHLARNSNKAANCLSTWLVGGFHWRELVTPLLTETAKV